MRLDARIKKLEDSAHASQAVGEYDDWSDYFGHHLYYCDPDGKNVQSITLFATGGRYEFDTEMELWNLYPAGTRFKRHNGNCNHEVIDGVVRQLNFPPDDGKISPETQAAISWLFEPEQP